MLQIVYIVILFGLKNNYKLERVARTFASYNLVLYDNNLKFN